MLIIALRLASTSTPGNIPNYLSDILVPPAKTSSKPKRRAIKARVLTDDEFMAILLEKEKKEPKRKNRGSRRNREMGERERAEETGKREEEKQ